MRIVIISPFYNKLTRGVERFTYTLASEFSKNNIECVLYTWSEKNPINWNTEKVNFKIRKVPYFRYFQKYIAVFFYRIWFLLDRPSTTILNFLYHGERFLPFNKQYLYVLHSPSDQIQNRYIYIEKYSKSFRKLRFVAVSNYVKKMALPYFQNNLIEVVYNGVDLDKFKPINLLRFKDKTNIKIVSFCALEERKGVQFLLNALGVRDKRDFVYHIYGEGPFKHELLNLISILNLNDYVKIFSPIENVEYTMNNYDLFCLLSKGEAFPLSPLEALSCGIPILTSSFSPFDEFVVDGIGKMVDVFNTNEINKAIDELIDFQDNSKIIQYSKLFDSKIQIQKYIKLLS